jgi:hypothetical protein
MVQETDVLDETSPYGEITWVTDPAMLLPGEDSASMEVRDAVHWSQVYRELIGITGALLERSESSVRGMTAEATEEAGETRRVLRAQRAQYLARYEFWRERVAALSRDDRLADPLSS